MYNVKDIFLDIIKYDTTSDELSKSYPSTETQLQFGKMLADKLKTFGASNIEIDKYGYVTAEIPSNTEKECPTVGFIAHMDTSPECSGKNINPIITENYNGKDIVLNGIILSPTEFPALLKYKGKTIISSDGTTLLGADDKAGIAEILSAIDYIVKNDTPHGKIKIAFTPDEEIGKGVDYFDVKKFGADFAYTFDGGELGELEYENFNASRLNIEITGKSVHPGYAKNTMINASLIGAEIISSFPPSETPSRTEGYSGFFHLCSVKGSVSKCNLSYIIRDFDKNSLEERKLFASSVIKSINEKYGNVCAFEIYDEYENMISQFDDKMYIVDIAKKAMENKDITPNIRPIRGGTDGARLSFMGLSCPNIFAGGHNFHGPFEFIPVSSMEKAVDVIVEICRIVAEENII